MYIFLVYLFVTFAALALIALIVRLIVLALEGERFYSFATAKALIALAVFYSFYIMLMVSDA